MAVLMLMTALVLKEAGEVEALTVGFGSSGSGYRRSADEKKYDLAWKTLREIVRAYNNDEIKKIIELVNFPEKEKISFEESLLIRRQVDESKNTELYFDIKDHSTLFSKVTIKLTWEKRIWKKLNPRSVDGVDRVLSKGSAEFIFHVKNSAKLSAIKGDSPF